MQENTVLCLYPFCVHDQTRWHGIKCILVCAGIIYIPAREYVTVIFRFIIVVVGDIRAECYIVHNAELSATLLAFYRVPVTVNEYTVLETDTIIIAIEINIQSAVKLNSLSVIVISISPFVSYALALASVYTVLICCVTGILIRNVKITDGCAYCIGKFIPILSSVLLMEPYDICLSFRKCLTIEINSTGVICRQISIKKCRACAPYRTSISVFVIPVIFRWPCKAIICQGLAVKSGRCFVRCGIPTTVSEITSTIISYKIWTISIISVSLVENPICWIPLCTISKKEQW